MYSGPGASVDNGGRYPEGWQIDPVGLTAIAFSGEDECQEYTLVRNDEQLASDVWYVISTEFDGEPERYYASLAVHALELGSDTATATIPPEGGEIAVRADDGTTAIAVLGASLNAIPITMAIGPPDGTFAEGTPGARHVVSVDAPDGTPYAVKVTWHTPTNPPGFGGGPPHIAVFQGLSTPPSIKNTFNGRDETGTAEWTSEGASVATVVETGNHFGIHALVPGDTVDVIATVGDPISGSLVAYEPNGSSCFDIDTPANGPPIFGEYSTEVTVGPSYAAVPVDTTGSFDGDYDAGCEAEFTTTCVAPGDGAHTDDTIVAELNQKHFTVQLGPNLVVRGNDLSVIAIAPMTCETGDEPPPGGGDGDADADVGGPEMNVLAGFDIFENTQRSSLASTAADAVILVGGKVLHTFEPPPGVPPPPPPGPQPELVQAILALDPVTGDELARLPLGDFGDAGLSCQLLSHDGASGRIDQFFIYGQVNFASTVWNPDINDFGAVSVSVQVKNVTDFSRYNNDQFGGGGVAAWFEGHTLFFFEHDPALGLFAQVGTLDSSQYAGASGGCVSGFRWEAGGQTVFVTDGQPGELWSHPGTGTLAQAATDATKIGNLGNGPRQIRFAGEIGVVSNFDSGTLTIVRRQGNGTVTILGTVTVGSGPIAVDLRLNAAGNIEVLSTGFNDHTYTLTTLSPTGAVIGTPVTRTVPSGGKNPVSAIFVTADGTRISITCNGSDKVLIFDLPTS
jgi:hypothetical protein